MTDGTVKNGKGGATYSLHTTENPGSVRTVLPVDGLPIQISSYCTELVGILNVILLLNRILQKEATQWQRLTVVLWCNNEAAVNRFNTLEGCKHFAIASTNQGDADVLHELQCIKA